MKKIILSTMVILTLFACSEEGRTGLRYSKSKFTQADTLIREALRTCNYQRALILADSLEQTGDFSSLRANNYRGDAYSSLGRRAESKECYRRATANNNPPNYDLWCYQEAGNSLARQLYLNNDYEGALRMAMTILATIDSLGAEDESTSVGLDALMGYCNQALGKPRQAKENYERAYQRILQWLDRDSSAIALLWGVETYNTIAERYLESHEYDEAMRWVNRTDSLMPPFVEFYSSRTPEGVDTYRAAQALIRARAALGQGRQELAERAFADYNRTDCSKTIGGRICATNYLMEAHRYAEAADCYAETDQFMATYYSDVTLDHIQETYMPKLRANLYAGRKDSVLYVARQITEVYDTALAHYKRSAATELATVYDTQGKERQIAEQQAELLKQRLWGIAGALALVIAFFAAHDLHRRRARRRLAAAHADLETAHADLQMAYDKLEETTAAKERIESELRIARDIQMSMVPSTFPDYDGLDLYAEMTPAKQVGGDLYGYLLLSNYSLPSQGGAKSYYSPPSQGGARGGSLYFCVGDVSGKGVPASLFMAQSVRLFQSLAKEGLMPADIASRMNRELAENNEQNMFVTMFIGLVDLSTGRLDFCNCGHNPPVIDGEFLEMKHPNMPLGLWADFDLEGEHIDDIRGRQILIYTDGLNEAMNLADEQFGDERLIQLMAQAGPLNAHQVIDMLTKSVEAFRDGAEPNDDLTLMCLRI